MKHEILTFLQKLWPFVSRRKYENNHETTFFYNETIGALQKELDAKNLEIEKLIEPIIKKFLQIKAVQDASPSNYNRYALHIALDTYWVEYCFTHGDSEREIDVFCEVMAGKIKNELQYALKSRNFLYDYSK